VLYRATWRPGSFINQPGAGNGQWPRGFGLCQRGGDGGGARWCEGGGEGVAVALDSGLAPTVTGVTVPLHNQVSVQVVGGLVRSGSGGAVVAPDGKLTLMMMVARPTIELGGWGTGGERR
jgi:hypothetical protein